MADLIISQPMTFTVDVKTGLVERPQRESLMRGDKYANRIIVELVDGSEPFDITGVTVKGEFCKPPNGDSIDLSGEAKGNVAEVQLTDQCYTAGGHYEARVILVLGEVERTVLFISGDVLKSGSGNAAGDEPGSTGSGLPAGGTAGQVLVKVSSAQGDAIWKTLTAEDVGARPNTWTPTAGDVGALPSGGTAKNSEKLGGKAPEYYLQPRTLLDNPDFKIAQAGYNAYHGTKWFVADRWEGYARVTASVSGGIVTLTNPGASASVWQYVGGDISALIGKPITVAMRLSDGTLIAGNKIVPDIPETGSVVAASVSENGVTIGAQLEASGKMYLSIYLKESQSISFEWCQIFLGTYTADNMPPYVAPDPVLELAKCKNFYKFVNATVKPVFGDGTATRTYAVEYGEMRANLNASSIEIISAYERIGWNETGAAFSIASVFPNNNTALIYATGNVAAGSQCWLMIKIACNADL